MSNVIAERWEKIQTLSLKHGSHEPDSQFCVMEAVAFVAGEPWTDHPTCACPIISEFMRTWNDRLSSDKDRDRLLKQFVPRLVGTRNPAVEVKRVIMIGDWTVRNVLPELFRLMGKHKEAAELAALPEIDSAGKLEKALARARALALARARAFPRDLSRALVRGLEASQSALVERMIEIR